MLATADPQIAAVIRRVVTHSAVVLWAYLVLVTAAELVTSLVSPQLGQLAHVVLLGCLVLHGAIGTYLPSRRLALALALAPLIRVLSLGLPLLRFPQIAWYPLVALPLLLAAGLIIRQLELTRRDLGLRLHNPALQLLLVPLGVGLGVIEYVILLPSQQFAGFSWVTFVLATLNLLIFTGFTEELIFRGVLQTVARQALGRWALIYVSLLFGVLHIGYLSLIDVVFVSCVGLLFAYIVRRTGSILGVTLAHGVTNMMLFLVLPQVEGFSVPTVATLTPWLMQAGTLCALAVAVLLAVRHLRACLRLPQAEVQTSLQKLRAGLGLTRVALAQRAGLAAVALAEIELGVRAMAHDEARRLAPILGVSSDQLLLR